MKSIITVRPSSTGGHVITLMDVWGCVIRKGILNNNTAVARNAFKRKYIIDQKNKQKKLTTKPDMKQKPQRERSENLFEDYKVDARTNESSPAIIASEGSGE